jgi:hypothetical protein
VWKTDIRGKSGPIKSDYAGVSPVKSIARPVGTDEAIPDWIDVILRVPLSGHLLYRNGLGDIVKELKTVSVSFRVWPPFKRALQMAAASVTRMQTNLLETLLFEYCDTHGIKVKSAQGLGKWVARKTNEYDVCFLAGGG